MRKVMLVLAVAALAVLGMSCNQLKARDQLNKGVQAFTAAQYPEAVERFKTAVELDPGFAAARLYLATAYMQDHIAPPRPPVSRNCLHAAVHPRLGCARKRQNGRSRLRQFQEGAGPGTEKRHRHRVHRFPQPQPEEMGRGAAVV